MNRSNFGVVLVNKKRRPLRINDLRFCCVQDEDTRFEMFCFGLFSFVVVMFYINN